MNMMSRQEIGFQPRWDKATFAAQLMAKEVHYHIHHPFNVRMQEGSLTPEQIRGWVANRFYYQIKIPQKDAAILANCPDRETRRRWLVTKLGLAAAAAVVAAGVLVLLVTWWRVPFVRLQGRMDNSVFDAEGTVVLGYTLFALALCTLVGVLWRRAVPALMVGFAGYFAVRVLFDSVVRQHLLTPLQTTWRAEHGSSTTRTTSRASCRRCSPGSRWWTAQASRPCS